MPVSPSRGAISKRLTDIIGASVGLIIAAPVLAATGAAIMLTDGKPVLFRQQRVGMHGRKFEILKFRSMSNGAPGLQISSDSDPRITKIGAIIRRSKVDELPQLINVLRGEMSLVGPRPEVPHYVDHWPAELQPIILSARPGITDPASIAFRHESALLATSDDPEETYIVEILPAKASMYVDYINTHSLRNDLRIIVRTLIGVAIK